MPDVGMPIIWVMRPRGIPPLPNRASKPENPVRITVEASALDRVIQNTESLLSPALLDIPKGELQTLRFVIIHQGFLFVISTLRSVAYLFLKGKTDVRRKSGRMWLEF